MNFVRMMNVGAKNIKKALINALPKMNLNYSILWDFNGLRWFETDISGLHIGPSSKVKLSRNVGFKPPHAA